MASEATTLRWMEKVLTLPRPTRNDWEAQQLAYALGYPSGWRVVRHLEEVPPCGTTETPSSDITNPTKTIIVDRIVAAEEDENMMLIDTHNHDVWFHHAAAAEQAEILYDSDGNEIVRERTNGHLLPKLPKFEVKQQVQVLYEGSWYDARILKRKQKGDSYLYQVMYKQDKSKQNNVDESFIRPSDETPLAIQLGLGDDWKATKQSGKYVITSPDGTVYKSVAEALAAYRVQDEGDPPWRITGHTYLGRSVRWVTHYQVSSRRVVEVEQIGKVVGYIAASDVDSAGNPGFVSSKTGQPANLFHVTFDDNPSTHAYPSALIEFQDLEEWELEEKLLP